MHYRRHGKYGTIGQADASTRAVAVCVCVCVCVRVCVRVP